MSAAKKQKTVELPKLPKISDALDGPVVQTLATVCSKLYDPALFAVFKPQDGKITDQLNQSYEMVTKSGAYKEGGVYSADDSSYTGGDALVSGYHVFNKDTTCVVEGKPCGSQSLAEYGTVIDGFTDFHGEFQCVTPPFAALVVQPNDKNEVRALLPEAPSTLPPLPAERMLPTSGRPPSSSSPGADPTRQWTGSTISRLLPLSVRHHSVPADRAPQLALLPNPGA